jgi:hypothetical protein
MLTQGGAACGAQWFTKKDDIVPYIDKHWGALCTGRARTATWWSTVGTCLYTDAGELFAWYERAQEHPCAHPLSHVPLTARRRVRCGVGGCGPVSFDTPRSAASKFALADTNLYNITPSSLPAMLSAPRPPRVDVPVPPPQAVPTATAAPPPPRRRRDEAEGNPSVRDRTRTGGTAPAPKKKARPEPAERDPYASHPLSRLRRHLPPPHD